MSDEVGLTKQEVFDKLIRTYLSYFTVENDITINGISYNAIAEYHSRGEKYFLTKKAKLWAAETNEYVYFIICENLNAETLNKLFSEVINYSLTKIKPHSEHMFSYISMVIITDQPQQGVLKETAKLSFKKNFKLSLHGWAEFRVVLLDVSERKIITNSSGREIAKNFKKSLKNFYIN